MKMREGFIRSSLRDWCQPCVQRLSCPAAICPYPVKSCDRTQTGQIDVNVALLGHRTCAVYGSLTHTYKPDKQAYQPLRWRAPGCFRLHVMRLRTRQDVTRLGLWPFFNGWCRRRRRWASWWCGGHRLPAAGALGHVRIIPRRLDTVVPDRSLELGRSRRWRLRSGGRLDKNRRCIWGWIGIHRSRIPVPYPTDDPPPAKPTRVSPMEPMSTTPDDEIVLMKTTDAAAP